MVIKTGCSASLVVLHEACRALQSNDCEAAIVAGTNLIIGPMTTAEMTQEGILSLHGSCKTFDDGADGFCRGDGVGTVVLKRLEDAEDDNDPILAVVLGTATNHSSEAPSITRPHGPAQEFLYRKILNGKDSNILGANYFHRVNTTLAVAAEVAFDTANPDNKPKLTAGAQYVLDPSAVRQGADQAFN